MSGTYWSVGADRPPAGDPAVGVRRGAPDPPSVLRWTVLCAAAEAVGMTAAAGAAKVSSLLTGAAAVGPEVALALGLVVSGGLVEGVALGVAQAFGLRRWLPRVARVRWVLVTVAVAGLGWAAASAPAVLAGDANGAEPPLALIVAGAAVLGAAMGAVLGGAQAIVLRGRVPYPMRWIGANVLAWSAAMSVILLGATAPGADWPAPAVVGLGSVTGLAAGAVLGLISGWFLPSLIGRPRRGAIRTRRAGRAGSTSPSPPIS